MAFHPPRLYGLALCAGAGGLELGLLFLEMLMGWPLGWTDSASPVMGFARWLRRSRSELSRLC